MAPQFLNFQYALYRQHPHPIGRPPGGLVAQVPGHAPVSVHINYPVPLPGVYPGVQHLGLPRRPFNTIANLTPYPAAFPRVRAHGHLQRRRLLHMVRKIGRYRGLRYLKPIAFGGQGVVALFQRPGPPGQLFIAKCTFGVDPDSLEQMARERRITEVSLHLAVKVEPTFPRKISNESQHTHRTEVPRCHAHHPDSSDDPATDTCIPRGCRLGL
jgi:hypothetical protein